jgi:hypothetical protein
MTHNKRDFGVVIPAQIFRDFGRPPSDCAFAIRSDTYRRAGGFQIEYFDRERQYQIHAAGWPLLFRLDFMNAKITYLDEPAYITSPRRLVEEPDRFFAGISYMGEIRDFRDQAGYNQYDRLDRLADKIDLKPVQQYIVKHYIFQRCITRPELLTTKTAYFGPLLPALSETIHAWRDRFPSPSAGDIFAFVEELNARFADEAIEVIRSLKLKA